MTEQTTQVEQTEKVMIAACPCGGTPVVTPGINTILRKYSCEECGLSGPFMEKDHDAISTWNLVVAAHDLLSACKAWVKYFDDLSRWDDPDDRLAQLRNQFHRARVEKSRAAVLKAEGK